ncbi:MAG: sialidase family protein [Armatimonadota bacterium]
MDHLLTAALLSATMATTASAAEHWLVRRGRAQSVWFEGERWRRGEGCLQQAGVGHILWSAKVFGEGDARVRARLRIHDLAGSAASVVLGGSSHFGFEGGAGEMFVEGPLFGGETQLLGQTPVEEGETFEFEARLEGRTISVLIDGREVHRCDVPASELGMVGLRPHRARMEVEELVVETGAPVTQWEPLPHTDVFVGGTGGYHTYRIPALVVSSEGTLLAFCEGRTHNARDHGDIDMMLRRSTDNGETWEPMQLVYDEEVADGAEGDREAPSWAAEDITIGNPCPVVDRTTGRIWLPFCRDNDDVFVTFSDDDGLTWAEPRMITASVKPSHWGWYATGPGVGIQLQRGPNAGRLVIPCDHRERVDDNWQMLSHVFYSDDHGETWRLGGSVAPHTDESQVVELTDASLMINCRNYWGRSGGRPDRANMRAIARSSDGGQSWGELRFDPTLVEPICQASFIRYSAEDLGGDRNRLLFANPASRSSRTQMTVRLSYDEGETWPVSRLVHPGPAAYSCLAALPDGRIGLLYERDGYRRISFVAFDLQWLTDGADTLAGR